MKPVDKLDCEFMLAPAAFRRLCVETEVLRVLSIKTRASRLQAAVC